MSNGSALLPFLRVESMDIWQQQHRDDAAYCHMVPIEQKKESKNRLKHGHLKKISKKISKSSPKKTMSGNAMSSKPNY